MSASVLAVDDERHILRSIKRSLRRQGYPIHLAESGDEALRILAESEIGVLISDQRMPGMNGAELLARSVQESPDTYRITLTGQTDLQSAQKSINEGCVNRFMLKPWDDDELRGCVAEGLRSYQLVRENRRLQKLSQEQTAQLQSWNRDLEGLVEERTAELKERNALLDGLRVKMEQSLKDTVGLLAGMLETISPSLGIHSKRVARLALRLGEALDLEGRNLLDLEFAAHLHDLGRIEGLLRTRTSKAGTRKPRQGATQRASAGAALLDRVAGFEAISESVRLQAERFDGRGGQGLSGEKIPLPARIIALVNSFDERAFSGKDPTKPRIDDGCKRLVTGKGTRFDPALVDLFLELISSAGKSEIVAGEVEVSSRQIRPGMVLSRDLYNSDGVLLLKTGARLTADLIERMEALDKGNALLQGVFVKSRA